MGPAVVNITTRLDPMEGGGSAAGTGFQGTALLGDTQRPTAPETHKRVDGLIATRDFTAAEPFMTEQSRREPLVEAAGW
jgi:hypothetical protein